MGYFCASGSSHLGVNQFCKELWGVLQSSSDCIPKNMAILSMQESRVMVIKSRRLVIESIEWYEEVMARSGQGNKDQSSQGLHLSNGSLCLWGLTVLRKTRWEQNHSISKTTWHRRILRVPWVEKPMMTLGRSWNSAVISCYNVRTKLAYNWSHSERWWDGEASPRGSRSWEAK